MAEVKRDWSPRRRGELYCSPACGGGCTHADYLLAQRRARALAKKAGKGWKVRVHENLGWHYNVVKGVSALHEYRHPYRTGKVKGYTLFVNTEPQIVTSGNSPKECFVAAQKRADEITAQMALLADNL